MKKMITLFFSLLVAAGIKAQTTPQIKKETVLPTNNTSVVNQTITPDLKAVPKTADSVSVNGSIDKAYKVTNVQTNPTLNNTVKDVKPMKETPVSKPHKY